MPNKTDNISELVSNYYANVYNELNKYEFLLSPILASANLATKFGIHGAIAGTAMGLVDEAMIYSGYTSQHHFTHLALGLGTFESNTIIANGLGSTIGLLTPYLGYVFNYGKPLAPAIDSMIGYRIAGVKGALIGGLAGVIDEALVSYNITSKHYLTHAIISYELTTIMAPKLNTALNSVTSLYAPLSNAYEVATKAVANLPREMTTGVASIILGGIFAKLIDEQDMQQWLPIQLGSELYDSYSQIIGKEELDQLIEKQIITTVGAQVLVQHSFYKFVGHKQNLQHALEQFGDGGNNAWVNYQLAFFNGAKLIPLFIFSYIIKEVINDYFAKKMAYIVEDKIRNEWYNGEAVLKLSQPNSEVLSDNIHSNVNKITYQGSDVLISSVSAVIGGSYGMSILLSAGLTDLIVYSFLYSQATRTVSETLAAIQTSYTNVVQAQETRIINILKHNARNLKTITERNGIEFERLKLQEEYNYSRTLEIKQEFWSTLDTIWETSLNVISYLFNNFIMAYKLHNNALDFDMRLKAINALDHVSSFASWSGDNSMSVQVITKAILDVNNFIKQLRNNDTNLDANLKHYYQLNSQALVLKNMTVSVGNNTLVIIDSLKLEFGKVYAFTGPSGCGKSSLLSKIQGIRHNGITASGEVYYPTKNEQQPTKVVSISQQDYFPLYSTLLEVINYPSTLPTGEALEELRNKIIKLIKEIGLDKKATINNELQDNISSLIDEEKDDWAVVLSGGQKKKVILVSALIKQPEILLLDEVFNGLDSDSIINIQKIIKSYLPDALIVVVDHHAHDNNFNGFYDQEVNFSNHTIQIKPVEPIEINDQNQPELTGNMTAFNEIEALLHNP